MKSKVVLLIVLACVLTSVRTVTAEGLSQEDPQVPHMFSTEVYPGSILTDKFSVEVYETIKKYWTDQLPIEVPNPEGRLMGAAIMVDGKKYYQWPSWACPYVVSGTRYRIEKFVYAIEDSGADAMFAERIDFSESEEVLRTNVNCIGLFIVEEDAEAFGDALDRFECSTNHTPFRVGEPVYLGWRMRNRIRDAYQKYLSDARYEEEQGFPVPVHLQEKVDRYEHMTQAVDQPLEVIEICEDLVTVEFPRGESMTKSWEKYIRTAPDTTDL